MEICWEKIVLGIEYREQYILCVFLLRSNILS